MQLFNPLHGQTMGNGMELELDQNRTEGSNPGAYSGGPVAHQAHYMAYNYPNPQYAAPSQDAFFMQNIQEHSEVNAEASKHISWNHNMS